MPRADFGELPSIDSGPELVEGSRAVQGVKVVFRSPSTLSTPRPVGEVSNGLTYARKLQKMRPEANPHDE